MCGRFAFRLSWRELHDLLRFGVFPERLDQLIKASYNVAPTHECVIAHGSGAGRTLALSTWQFTPSWWDRPEPPKFTINARAETAASSPMFRAAFRSSRCVVPASGYYEWQARPDGTKQPVYIRRADGAPLIMGGVHAQRDCADTFAILTTGAPHGMEQIHARSPVILEPEDVDRWLADATGPAEVQAMCRPAPDGVLAWHPVSTAVGNVRNNGPQLIEPVPR
jgi:putative SOS response-associated peptidase YedK